MSTTIQNDTKPLFTIADILSEFQKRKMERLKQADKQEPIEVAEEKEPNDAN